MTRLPLPAAAAVALLAGCSTLDSPAYVPPAVAGTSPPVPETSMSPATFITTAEQAGMLELEASRLALRKASSADVKQFAQHMIDVHERANRELIRLAEEKFAVIPTTLTFAQGHALDELRKLSGSEFDRAYAKTVAVDAHAKAVAMFDAASRDLSDQDVKAFAQKTLPTLRQHLGMGRRLEREVGAG
jgi:putative membrane protein